MDVGMETCYILTGTRHHFEQLLCSDPPNADVVVCATCNDVCVSELGDAVHCGGACVGQCCVQPPIVRAPDFNLLGSTHADAHADKGDMVRHRRCDTSSAAAGTTCCMSRRSWHRQNLTLAFRHATLQGNSRGHRVQKASPRHLLQTQGDARVRCATSQGGGGHPQVTQRAAAVPLGLQFRQLLSPCSVEDNWRSDEDDPVFRDLSDAPGRPVGNSDTLIAVGVSDAIPCFCVTGSVAAKICCNASSCVCHDSM
eukprot:m.251217 g.251217  ORF g.251217 m.251217 type:complete len:254 (-) comp19536_c0_seq4:162-923(-)